LIRIPNDNQKSEMTLRQYFRYIKNTDNDDHNFSNVVENPNILIDYNKDKEIVQKFLRLK
jgi:hypothetical protein